MLRYDKRVAQGSSAEAEDTEDGGFQKLQSAASVGDSSAAAAMEGLSTDDLKSELIRRVQSRDPRWNRSGESIVLPGGPGIVDEATLEQMTQGLQNGVPPAALQGFRFAQITEDSLSISAPLEHTWNGAGIGFAGSLATLVAYTGASMAGQANKRAGYPTANAFCATGTIKYVDKVADEQFYATARFKHGAEGFAKFKQEMDEIGKARMECVVQCHSGGNVCVEFEGSYACNDPQRSKRGNIRYSKYDKRGPQGGAESKL